MWKTGYWDYHLITPLLGIFMRALY